jgi:hypothetical protein
MVVKMKLREYSCHILNTRYYFPNYIKHWFALNVRYGSIDCSEIVSDYII